MIDKRELLQLIHDERTVVALHTNNGNGEDIICLNAFIRNDSPLREKHLNPHRNMSEIPRRYVEVCPSCQSDWQPVVTDVFKNKIDRHYVCASGCPITICEDTYNKFALQENSNRANLNLNILPSEGESEPRGDETQMQQPLSFDEVTVTEPPVQQPLTFDAPITAPLTFNPVTGEFE